jgi:site-specific recombinase XerD
MVINLYVRHKATCEHKADPTWKRCDCSVWFQTNIDGEQNRWSSKTSSWEAAARKARLLEQQAENGGSVRTTAKTVKEAIEEFLNHKRTFITKRGRRIADDTFYRHELTLKKGPACLQDYCDQHDITFLKDIGLPQLDKWKIVWTVETAYARSSFQARVQNFFSFCHSRGMITTNPTEKLDKIPVKAGENVRALEPKEYERVIASVDKTTMTSQNKARIKVLMQLQRWSGLSLVDAVCLSKDELQQDGETFRIVTERQKTETHINNVIPKWLGKELLTVKNGNPEYFFWTGTTTPEDAPSYFQKLYRKVFKAAGVKESSHAFRHTFAIEHLKKGTDIRAVSKALGHSSVTITERYYSRWCKGQQVVLDDALTGGWEK